jgi:hypothetical protein
MTKIPAGKPAEKGASLPTAAQTHRTMLYMALSLAFTAGGIILLYALWDAKSVEGKPAYASPASLFSSVRMGKRCVSI